MNGITMRAGDYRLRRGWLVLVCAAICALAASASAHAAVFNVNTTADPNPQGCPDATGACSLREAIAAAGPNDTIFVPAAAAHYVLTRGPLTIGQSGLVINGNARGTVIDGAGASRVFDIGTGASPSLSQLTITGGTASGLDPQGGGIRVRTGAVLTLSNSTVRDNVATGSVTNGTGGGIYNAGTLEARGVTITKNAASIVTASPTTLGIGGGIDNEGGLTLVNSTITDNVAGGDVVLGQGGGLATGAGHVSTLTNVTVASNRTGLAGSGSNVLTAGSTRAQNTIVAGGTGGANCSAPTQSLGNNIEQDTDTCGFDRPRTNPQLAPLTDNGGPTDTRALLAGSPAINAGSSSGCPPTDQRGVPRPQGPRCDIGAYEFAFESAGTENSHSHSTSSNLQFGSQPTPTLGKSFNLVPVRGTVTYLLPGTKRYETLLTVTHVPLGTTVEASDGTARVISARNDAGKQQSADFYDGPFQVRQSLDPRRAGKPRTGITDLYLRFGNFSACSRARRKQIQAVAARKRRRLWGRGKGSYRTRGNYGSASVRGTWWLTKDVCGGTEFYVREGTVTVRDNTLRKNITLRAGRRYLAKAPPANVTPRRGSQ